MCPSCQHGLFVVLRFFISRSIGWALRATRRLTCPRSSEMVTRSFLLALCSVGLCHQLLVPSTMFVMGCRFSRSELLASHMPHWDDRDLGLQGNHKKKQLRSKIKHLVSVESRQERGVEKWVVPLRILQATVLFSAVLAAGRIHRNGRTHGHVEKGRPHPGRLLEAVVQIAGRRRSESGQQL